MVKSYHKSIKLLITQYQKAVDNYSVDLVLGRGSSSRPTIIAEFILYHVSNVIAMYKV